MIFAQKFVFFNNRFNTITLLFLLTCSKVTLTINKLFLPVPFPDQAMHLISLVLIDVFDLIELCSSYTSPPDQTLVLF